MLVVLNGIVSLLTNTHIQESLAIIKSKLEKDKSLRKKSLSTLEDIMEYLEFLDTTTCSRFDGVIHQHCLGTTMGGLLPPVSVKILLVLKPPKIIKAAIVLVALTTCVFDREQLFVIV